MASYSAIAFNKALKKLSTPEEKMHFMREQILHGTPHVFEGRESEYFEFRTSIANHFDVGFHEVFIVGSGKLGYSFVKGTEFSLNSDIDVVLVSSVKFEEILAVIRDYDYAIGQGKVVLDIQTKKQYYKFLRYLTRGWMRPDLLPYNLQEGQLQGAWLKFFESISYGKSVVGNYKVTAGLFKSYAYMERYYLSSIERHYDKLRI